MTGLARARRRPDDAVHGHHGDANAPGADARDGARASALLRPRGRWTADHRGRRCAGRHRHARPRRRARRRVPGRRLHRRSAAHSRADLDRADGGAPPIDGPGRATHRMSRPSPRPMPGPGLDRGHGRGCRARSGGACRGQLCWIVMRCCGRRDARRSCAPRRVDGRGGARRLRAIRATLTSGHAAVAVVASRRIAMTIAPMMNTVPPRMNGPGSPVVVATAPPRAGPMMPAA